MSPTPTQPSATIRAGAHVVTLINSFTVAADQQQRLLEEWRQATEEVIRHLPGFVSASIHASLDGTRVVNYAQWETREAFAAMFADPRARAHLSRLAEIGTADPVLCEVVSVHLAGDA